MQIAALDHLNPQSREYEYARSTLKTVALNSLKELAAGLVLVGVCCPFVATSTIPLLLASAMSITVFNASIRVFAEKISDEITRSDTDLELLKTMRSICRLLCPISFSILDVTTRNVLVHEAGHAVAAVALFKESAPKIEIFFLSGGVTTYRARVLTQMGQFLGMERSRVVVTAAGSVFGVLAATVHLGAAYYFSESSPEISRYLLVTAVMAVAQHVLYAMSALWIAVPEVGHDFVKLWTVGGIHPIAATAAIVALPVLVGCFIYTRKSLN